MRNFASRNFWGLTLVELLVAMAILVTVTASTMLIFRGISRAWRTGEMRSERYQQARLLFDLFERELSSSVSNARYPFIGLRAEEESPLHDGPAVDDEVVFVGTLPGRSGFVERGYRRTAEGDFLCHDDDSGDGDYTTGSSELCGRDVSQFTVAYFDGDTWVDQWEGKTAGELPRAVHIIMTVGREKAEQFETVIYVPTS
jgi:type II secretory pathway pseudopilin PulG